jgi:AAA15 family ATPase/GTPase
MLIQFEVDNFTSIKETVKLNLRTQTSDLLQSVVIYGANASGKSNVLKAIKMMASLVLNKNKVLSSEDRLEHKPFLLNTQTEEDSTTFEMIFIIDKIIYRYGFEYDSKIIYAEWLFAEVKGREAKLFYRDIEEDFYVNTTKFKEGKGLAKKTLENHLFLWKCNSDNGEISKKILKWFSNLNMLDGLKDNRYLGYTTEKLNDKRFKKDILEMMQIADLGISDMNTQDNPMPLDEEFLALPEDLQKALLRSATNPLTIHKKFDENNHFIENVEFSLKEHESLGTKKFFALSAPILDTLKNGKILVIDEIDASLHPLLTKYLISMFHDTSLNKYNAQLIFATHDTNLLQNDLLSREQIWFTDKDKFGATELYSLLEYENKTRKDNNKEKYYLQGRYGGIPYIGDFSFEEMGDES